MSKRILLIGETSRIEFRESCQWLAQNFSCCQFDSIPLVPDSLAKSPSDIILFQSVRGEFPDYQLIALRKRFPLVSFCCVFGSWIEGETRSGRPVSGIPRVSSQQFVSSVRNLFWNRLPTTAAADEQWLDVGFRESDVRKGISNVFIAGYDRTFVDGLASACSELGFSVTAGSLKPNAIPAATDCVIYDAARQRQSRIRDVQRIKRLNTDAYLAVLIDFPRVEEKEELIAAGASEVISKPFHLAQLLFEKTDNLNP